MKSEEAPPLPHSSSPPKPSPPSSLPAGSTNLPASTSTTTRSTVEQRRRRFTRTPSRSESHAFTLGSPPRCCDSSRRFGRYSDLLGAGAVKKVYRGFGQEEGRDVAWNQVKLRSFSGDPSVLKRLFSVPVKFSSGLQGRGICPQIISCDRTWMNKAKKQKKSQQIHENEEESIDSD
ncbi:hypothetical protein LXL04_012140 [Taraxacum kok-saghyz]